MFTDGTTEDIDAIIFATGYDADFGFLPDEAVSACDNGFRGYSGQLRADLSQNPST